MVCTSSQDPTIVTIDRITWKIMKLGAAVLWRRRKAMANKLIEAAAVMTLKMTNLPASSCYAWRRIFSGVACCINIQVQLRKQIIPLSHMQRNRVAKWSQLGKIAPINPATTRDPNKRGRTLNFLESLDFRGKFIGVLICNISADSDWS